MLKVFHNIVYARCVTPYASRGVTSEPLCEIKFLNLWKYLWMHHLSGKMSLVLADLVILPPDMGPKFFNVVLYEYLSVFLNTSYKNSTL